MRIEELVMGQKLTLQIVINSEQLEFPLTIMEVVPKKHGIYTNAIMKDEKVLSFKASGILTHLIVAFDDAKPHIFYNVTVQTLKSDSGNFCYFISTLGPSKEFNRRGAFRCFLGLYSSVQIGVNNTALDTTIKDVSVTGFSFILPATAREFKPGAIAHVVLTDYIQERNENYTFHLTGIIVRNYKLENGSTVYGCKLNAKVIGLDRYITIKERLQLNKSRKSH
ncbi:MAG: PilZ domain-containing protein [Lachnospiraceae bacterium]|nr:PilZ domain-containing protein [Lachnospiraceae bacterium]